MKEQKERAGGLMGVGVGATAVVSWDLQHEVAFSITIGADVAFVSMAGATRSTIGCNRGYTGYNKEYTSVLEQAWLAGSWQLAKGVSNA